MEGQEDMGAIVAKVLIRRRGEWSLKNANMFFDSLRVNVVRGRDTRSFFAKGSLAGLTGSSEDCAFNFASWLLHHVFDIIANKSSPIKDSEEYIKAIADVFLMIADCVPAVFSRIFEATLEDIKRLMLEGQDFVETRCFGLKEHLPSPELEIFPVKNRADFLVNFLLKILENVASQAYLDLPNTINLWETLTSLLQSGQISSKTLSLKITLKLLKIGEFPDFSNNFQDQLLVLTVEEVLGIKSSEVGEEEREELVAEVSGVVKMLVEGDVRRRMKVDSFGSSLAVEVLVHASFVKWELIPENLKETLLKTTTDLLLFQPDLVSSLPNGLLPFAKMAKGWMLLVPIVGKEVKEAQSTIVSKKRTREEMEKASKKKSESSQTWKLLVEQLLAVKTKMADKNWSEEDMEVVVNVVTVAASLEDSQLKAQFCEKFSEMLGKFFERVLQSENPREDFKEAVKVAECFLAILTTSSSTSLGDSGEKVAEAIMKIALLPLVNLCGSKKAEISKFLASGLQGSALKSCSEVSEGLGGDFEAVQLGFRLLVLLPPNQTKSQAIQMRNNSIRSIFTFLSKDKDLRCRSLVLENARFILANLKAPGFGMVREVLGKIDQQLVVDQQETVVVACAVFAIPCGMHGCLVFEWNPAKRFTVRCSSCSPKPGNNQENTPGFLVPLPAGLGSSGDVEFVESVILRAAMEMKLPSLAIQLSVAVTRWMLHRRSLPSVDFVRKFVNNLLKNDCPSICRERVMRRLPWFVATVEEFKFIKPRSQKNPSTSFELPLDLEEAIEATVEKKATRQLSITSAGSRSSSSSNSAGESLENALFGIFDAFLEEGGKNGSFGEVSEGEVMNVKRDVVVGIGSLAKIPRLQARCLRALTDLALYRTGELRLTAAEEIRRVAEWFQTTPQLLAALHAAELGWCLAAFVGDKSGLKEENEASYRSFRYALTAAWGFSHMTEAFKVLLHRIVCPVLVAALRPDSSFKGPEVLAEWYSKARQLTEGSRSCAIMIDVFPKIFPLLLASSKCDNALKLVMDLTASGIDIFLRAKFQIALNELLVNYSLIPDGVHRGIAMLAGAQDQDRVLQDLAKKQKKLTREQSVDFLSLKILGALNYFDTVFENPAVPLNEKLVAAKSLGLVIQFLGPEVVNYLRHKLLMTLRTLQKINSCLVAESAVNAWETFATTLTHPAAGSLAREIAISLLPWAEKCPAASAAIVRQLFHARKEWKQFVDPMLLDLTFLPTDIPAMASVSNQVLTDSVSVRHGKESRVVGVNSKHPRGLIGQINQAIAGLQLRDSELRRYALQRLRDALSEDRDAVLSLVSNVQENSGFVQEMIDVLMLTCRSVDSNLLESVAVCFGALGAIDPGQLQLGDHFTPNKDSEVQIFPNVREDNFIKDLINRLLRSFLSLDSLLSQNCCAYALQQVLRHYRIGPGSKAAGDLGPSSKGLVIWESLDSETKEVLKPLLISLYSVDKPKLGDLPSPPLFGLPYSDWLTTWLLVMMQDLKPETKQLFEATRPIFKVDIGIAQHLLPHMMICAVMEGKEVACKKILLEILAVLNSSAAIARGIMENDEVPLLGGLTGSSVSGEKYGGQVKEGRSFAVLPVGNSSDVGFHCTQTVFTALDYLNKWVLVMSKMRVSKATAETSWIPIEKFLGGINQLVMAEAALGCHAFRRALRHMEKYLQDNPKELQAKLRFLQYAYLHLDESDGVAGVAAVRTGNPNWRERIADSEASGKLHHALVSYERALKENPNSGLLLEGKLRTLLDMDQCQTVMTLCCGLDTTEKPAFSLEDFRIEAAWRLGDWDTLTDMAQNMSPGEAHSWPVDIGKALSCAYDNAEWTEIETNLRILRNLEVQPLTTASLESGSYTLGYSHILRLHMVNELESGLKLLAQWREPDSYREERIRDFESLVNFWESRTRIVQQSTRVLEPLQALRRSILGLFGSVASGSTGSKKDLVLEGKIAEQIDRSWLLSAKWARKSRHYQRAYTCLLNAERAGLDSASSTSCDMKNLRAQISLERAKLDWANGHQEEAIRLLTTTADLFMSASSGKQEDRDIAAMTRLQLTQRWEEAGYLEAARIRSSYEEVLKISPQWEEGHFCLAKYLDKVHYSSRNEGEKVQLQPDWIHQIITYYGKCLEYGLRHVYEALPRMLTIWLEFGTAVAEGTKNSAGRMTSKDLEKQLGEVTKTIRETFDNLPNFVLMTAFNQLVSRICHPSVPIFEALKDWIGRLVSAYPRRALWMMLAVLNYQHEVRRKRCHEALERAMRGQHGSVGLKKLIQDTKVFCDALLRLCQFPSPSQRQSNSMSIKSCPAGKDLVKFLEDGNFSAILVPISSLMAVTFPSLPGEAVDESEEASACFIATQWQGAGPGKNRQRVPDWKSHNAFPMEEVYFKHVEDEVDVMKSLQRPKKITVLGSNGKKFGFLCKAKDDLRKDCRLLEFTNLVNKCLRQDPEARKKGLYIRTYHVSPLNEDCGIIEWVPNCSTMRGILNGLYAHISPLCHDSVRKYYPGDDLPLERKRQAFLEKLLPAFPTVLPIWFQKNFPDPQAWYSARSCFVRTSAVVSIIGYILGLGDRHSENILVDVITGDAVHVDFNCLFNRGEQFAVPERVPCRLTHNIVGAMGPTGLEGVFRRACETTMRIVRDHKDSFVSVLESFVYDPLLDQVQQATRLGKGKDPAMLDAAVFEKASVLVEEIQERIRGVLRPRVIPVRGAGVGGGPSSSRRQPTSKLPLSIEGQVNHVIQEATSVDNLCQMFVGWAPYM